MMKLVGIGDLFIPSEYIEKGMKSLEEIDISVSTVEWQLNGFDELQNINLLVEQGGREDIEVPDYILDAVKDAARQSSDIGLPMTADLRLIMHTAKSDTHIFASEGTCNRLSETGLTYARRAVKA